jgi:N-acyl amino acid synthase of PEP-CTERM/exosortase system
MLLPAFLDIGIGFSKYFTAVPALTDDLRQQCFRIRHDVYCRDLGFEPERPEGIETDRYDAHSAHCLLRSRTNGEYVGCVRLVMLSREDPDLPLPFEQACARTLDRTIVDPARLARDRIAEVSRLAVASKYRRRKGEAKVAAGITKADFGNATQPRFPYIPVGLYLSMIAQARRHGIETLFMLTEPRLAKHLARLGVDLRRVGGPVEHRGERVPSMLSVDSVVRGLNFVVRPLYDVISKEVEAAYEAASIDVVRASP